MEFLILKFLILETQLQSYVLIPQFISIIMAALQRTYITAWAADDLKEIVSVIRKSYFLFLSH